jgi:P4 family phage/plasmid primase-like protien
MAELKRICDDRSRSSGRVEGNNTGVLLGAASGHLITIDFDDEAEIAPFVELNPGLATTLITKGGRGQNFWMRLIGKYPAKTFKLRTRGGKDIGEFRAGGSQTVIYGKHVSGVSYRPVVLAGPVELEWSELVWPEHFDVTTESDNAYKRLVDQYGESMCVSERGGVTLNEPFFVGLFMEQHKIAFCPGRGFYEYYCNSGVWKKITDARVKVLFSDDMHRYATESGISRVDLKRTNSTLTSLVTLLKGYAETDFQDSPRDFLHFQNGMLDIRSAAPVLRPFAPEYFSRNIIPFDFDPEAECPRFFTMLEEAVGLRDALLLLRWIGVALTGRNFAQKILLLLGRGGAGKGVLVKIITEIVGKENCVQLRTGLLNQRFELRRFVDKTLLIGSDVPGDFLNLAGAQVLKSLTGGDLLTVESKGQNGGWEIVGSFNVVVTSNQRLRVRLDGDHDAWARRLLPVEFKRPVERINPNIAEEIVAAEAAGIINLALARVQKVKEDYAKHGAFRLHASVHQRIANLIDESDSISAFIRSRIVPAQSEITTEELHVNYKSFCGERGWIELPESIFKNQSPQLMREFYGVVASHDIGSQRGYHGVKIKDNVCP